MNLTDRQANHAKDCEIMRVPMPASFVRHLWGAGIQQLRGTGYIAEKDLILVPEKKGLVHLVFQRLFLADLWRDLGNALPMFFFQKALPTFPFWYPFCMYMCLAACHGFNISFFIRLCDCALPFPINLCIPKVKTY